MARKKQTKTPEQRLGEALVPCEEQPYAVPDNWCWVRASAVLKPMETASPDGESFDYIDIDAIDNKAQAIREVKTLPVEKAPIRAKRKVHDGDTLFSMVRPYLRNIAYVDSSHDGCVASTGFYVCSPNAVIDRRYLYHLLCSDYTVNGLTSFMKGDNSPSIKKGDFDEFPLPLPPLAEQRRIVERVEGLFEKLDMIEFELQQAIEGSAERKDSILYDAFNAASEEDWNIVMVSQVVDSLKYGTSEKSSYENEGMAVLRIPNIGDGDLDFADMKYLSHRDVKKEDLLQENDILMIRSNGSRNLVGRCGIVPILTEEYTYASFLIRIRPSDDVCPAYLWRFLQSPQAREQLFNRAKSSSGIHNINSKEIGQTRLPLPPLDEQEATVNRLDASLAREGAVVHIVNETLTCIQNIRTNVLAKALQGKLGTNNGGDSLAREELLSMFGAITNNG